MNRSELYVHNQIPGSRSAPPYGGAVDGVRRWLAIYLGPLLITALACNHLWRAERLDQSSWKGGGFGMFSSIDNETFRAVRAWTGDRPLAFDGVDEDLVYRAKVVPTAANLRAVGQALLDRHPDVSTVRVRIDRAGFDGDANLLTLDPLREAVVER
jgi:hypothetical protein